MRDDSSRRRVVPEAANGSLWLAAVWTGVGAAVVCATLAIVVVAVCWLPVAGASGHPMSALHAGLLTYLAALHGGISVDGTFGAFLPLGLLLIVGVVAWRSGSALGDTAAQLDERDATVLGKALLVQTATFTAAALVAIPFAHLGTSSAPVLGVAGGAFLLFGVAAGAAFVLASELRRWLALRVPDVVWRAARAATAALTVYLGVGALLVAASLAVHHSRVAELSRQVGGGWGGVPILLLGVLAAPNAAIAAATYLAGPGFAVGTGTHVGPVGATHGLVPAFPVLGALPAGGASPVVWVLVALTPLSAGAVAARLCHRTPTWRGRFTDLGATVLAAGVLMGVLAWQGGGSVGPGRLAAVGASPWLSALAVAGEVGVVGAGALGLAALAARRRSQTRRPVLRPIIDVDLPVADAEEAEHDSSWESVALTTQSHDKSAKVAEPDSEPESEPESESEPDERDGAGKLAG